MSGVIDERGQQWEHCNGCGLFTRLEALGYEPPSTQFTCGRDLCLACVNAHPNIESIEPAAEWLPNYEVME